LSVSECQRGQVSFSSRQALCVRSAATSSPPVSAPVKPPSGKTAVVVGAGVGGLTLAGRLAREGYSVTLLEKNKEVGGRMQSYNPPGAPEYRFDTGPSLLLFPERYMKAFEKLGAKMEDYVEIKRVEPAAYRAHYGDGTSFDLLYDLEKMRRQIDAIEPGAGGKFIRWLGSARASLDLGVKAFIEQDSTSALDFVNPSKILELALAVNPLDLLLSQHRQMSQYFKSDKLRALFSFQELYVGLSPYNAPGVFSLLAATELTDGVWYPIGGFQKIRDGFLDLVLKSGVDVRCNTAVEKLIITEQGSGEDAVKKCTGVKLASGEVLTADVVVANPDLPYVYEELLEAQGPAKQEIDAEVTRLNKMDYSCGVLAYYFCLKGRVPGLLQHNVFLGSDYKGSWDRPWTPANFDSPAQPNFYVHNPTYTDTTCAPEGCDSVMVLLPVSNTEEGRLKAQKAGAPLPSREEMVNAGRSAILRRFTEAGFGDVESMIQHEFVYDPLTWTEKYNIKNGAVFGLSHGLLQLACFRPPTQTGLPATPWWKDSPKIQNLYFIGASTRPGNGVPLVLMGVEVQLENILNDQKVASN